MSQNNHYLFLKEDPQGESIFIIRKIYRTIYALITTFIIKCILLIEGVPFGKGFKSRGFSTIERFQCSSIIIGKNVRLNSSSMFNFRGLNHRCIIQTGKPKAIIRIGNNCGLSGCSIVANKKVIIGDNTTIGANVIIGDRDDHEEIYATEPRPIYVPR